MKEVYTCKHGITETLIGSNHECYCPECNMWLFSDKETKRKEMELNRDKQE